MNEQSRPDAAFPFHARMREVIDANRAAFIAPERLRMARSFLGLKSAGASELLAEARSILKKARSEPEAFTFSSSGDVSIVFGVDEPDRPQGENRRCHGFA